MGGTGSENFPAAETVIIGVEFSNFVPREPSDSIL